MLGFLGPGDIRKFRVEDLEMWGSRVEVELCGFRDLSIPKFEDLEI